MGNIRLIICCNFLIREDIFVIKREGILPTINNSSRLNLGSIGLSLGVNKMNKNGGTNMPTRELNRDDLLHSEDWVGNSAAFICPVCYKVFLVIGLLHRGHRKCPGCQESIGHVEGGKKTGGTAKIEW